MTQEQLLYIQNHITEINSPNFNLSATSEGNELFGSITNLKTFLKGFLIVKLNDPVFYDQIIQEFRALNFKKTKISEIANQFFVSKSDLQSFYDDVLQRQLVIEIDKDAYIKNSLEFIKTSITDQKHYLYTKNSLKKILEKQYDYIFSNGFPSNLVNINTGIMTANGGDSAQFLFLARAILAGYNCSNVDVRSSRYDAVVDFNNILLRLQIKGVSNSTSIKLKDRDRGGQGIDYKHETNRGKMITSADCDIYVVVDKEVGTCYLIPMSYVDDLTSKDIISINLNTIDHYKENWNIISEVADSKIA